MGQDSDTVGFTLFFIMLMAGSALFISIGHVFWDHKKSRLEKKEAYGRIIHNEVGNTTFDKCKRFVHGYVRDKKLREDTHKTFKIFEGHEQTFICTELGHTLITCDKSSKSMNVLQVEYSISELVRFNMSTVCDKITKRVN